MSNAMDRLKQRMEGVNVSGSADVLDAISHPPVIGVQSDIKKVPLFLIDPWQDTDGSSQPFHSYPADKLHELAENIKQNGLITPVRLRVSPFDANRYQTLAGHNRIAAAKLIGMMEIEAIVENVDDDAARLIMIDSNLQQREKLLPSEKAFAYKMRLEAIKHQGKATSVQVGQKLSRASVAEDVCESQTQIQRYIRLTKLIPALLDMVDADAIPFVGGVSLSFLSSTAQETLIGVLRQENITAINRAQADALKEICEKLDGQDAEDLILRIFGRGTAIKPPKRPAWKFETDYPTKIVKKYQHDIELQRRIAETIKDYVEEAEASKK